MEILGALKLSDIVLERLRSRSYLLSNFLDCK